MKDLTHIATNAQEMQMKHLGTFEAPTFEDLQMVKTGEFIKISVGREQFWCETIDVTGDRIIARIDNDLVMSHEHNLYCDDLVIINKKHIYSLFNI